MSPRTQHVILDRDGVLNVERADGGYIRDWSHWRWIPGALEGLRMLDAAGIHMSVATNQACVGRGLVTHGDLDAIHARMTEEAAREGVRISRIFVCPHLPKDGCTCRKPAPELLLRAIATSQLPREATVAIGDDLRDLQAAWTAGVRAALVRTGKGRVTEAMGLDHEVTVFDGLREFATFVLSDSIPDERAFS